MGLQRFWRSIDSRWRQPDSLTVFFEIAAEDADWFRSRLNELQHALGLHEIDTLHFLRMFVIDETRDLQASQLPARLVLNAVFDGTAAAFVEAFLDRGGPALAELLARCPGHPGQDSRAVTRWIEERSTPPDLFYIGPVGVRTSEIRAEDQLYCEIQTHLDQRQQAGDLDGLDPVQIRNAVRDHVRNCPGLPRGPRRSAPLQLRALKALSLARGLAVLLAVPLLLALLVPAARSSLVVLGFAWLAGILAVVLASFGVVRVAELIESDEPLAPEPGRVAKLVAREDHGPQNQFTMLSLVRPSRFRRVNLRITLFIGEFLVRHLWNRGKLVGVDTIHVARIHQIDGGRRMLFMSDFDGGWDRYLFDFLTTGSFAVVPIWTNLWGCPKTRAILFPPPGFAQKFLPFTRANQLETCLWYSAIGHLTMSEILRNAAIRRGLFEDRTADGIRAWLSLL